MDTITCDLADSSKVQASGARPLARCAADGCGAASRACGRQQRVLLIMFAEHLGCREVHCTWGLLRFALLPAVGFSLAGCSNDRAGAALGLTSVPTCARPPLKRMLPS